MTAPALLERPETQTGSSTGPAEICWIQEWNLDVLPGAGVAIAHFLEQCNKTAIRIAPTIVCPATCQGHWWCQPCYMLAVSTGLIS